MYKQQMTFAATTLAIASLSAFAEDVPLPSQQHWVDAKQKVTLENGVELSYVEMGASEGQPVLLLHGYTDNSRSWSLLAPYLDDRRLIALDLRGHGDSSAPSCCYGIDALANDVDSFMDTVGIDQADVVGHSLGSMTAATLAAYYSERVDELVLISTSAYMPTEATEWLWDNVPSMERPVDPDSSFMMDWYWSPNPVDEAFIKRERAESAAVPEEVWIGVLRSLTHTDWTQMASKIEAPTLILWGDQDSIFGQKSQQHVREVLPEARYIKYEGHGHNMFWEIPMKVGADITDFLNK